MGEASARDFIDIYIYILLANAIIFAGSCGSEAEYMTCEREMREREMPVGDSH